MGKRKDLYETEMNEQQMEQEEVEMEKKEAPQEELIVSLAETVRKENSEIRKEIGELDVKLEALIRKEGNFEKAVEEARGTLNENLKKRDEKFASELAKIRKEVPAQAQSPANTEAMRVQAEQISELKSKVSTLQLTIDGLESKIATLLAAIAQPAQPQTPAPAPVEEPHKPTTYERANPKDPVPVDIRTFYVCKAGDFSVCQESEELAREIANTIEPGKKHEPVRIAAWVDENGKFVRNLNATELLNLELVR